MRTKHFIITTGLVVSLMLLGACGSTQTSKSVQKHNNSGAVKDNLEKNKDAKQNGDTSDKSSVGTDQSTATSDQGQTSNQDGATHSNSDDTSSADKSTTTHENPPKTIKEALVWTGQTLNTRVPVLLPSNITLSNEKYLTAATHSETWYYKADFYGTKQPTVIDSKEAKNGELIASVEGTEYTSSSDAKDHINGYWVVNTQETMAMDLGHGVKAAEDAGMGHKYINWNEGRWLISINSPNDPTYQNKDYPDSKDLAEKVVTYLSSHYLPAPKQIGVINISTWKDINHDGSNNTVITWQDNQMVYQVSSSNPFSALDIAVSMNSK